MESEAPVAGYDSSSLHVCALSLGKDGVVLSFVGMTQTVIQDRLCSPGALVPS